MALEVNAPGTRTACADTALVRVALIEDDPEIRRRFVDIIDAAQSLVLAGVATTAAEGYALAESDAAEVYLVDLDLPDENGIGVIRYVAEHRPHADAMVVTVFGDDEHIIRSIEAGAAGYLLKDALPGEMVDCIRELRDGGSPVSPVIARRLLRLFRKGSPKPASASSPLSERETEILSLVAKGLSFAEIGKSLGISAHTVTTHVRKTYRKLSVNSRGEAVYEAQQLGLLW